MHKNKRYYSFEYFTSFYFFLYSIYIFYHRIFLLIETTLVWSWAVVSKVYFFNEKLVVKKIHLQNKNVKNIYMFTCYEKFVLIDFLHFLMKI